MKNKSRSNVLLVEILIAVLFFMLSATVLVRVFAAARNMTVRAGVETLALAEAQNVADALYASEDVEAALAAQGFESAHGVWTKGCGDYALYVAGESVPSEAGALWEGEIKAFFSQRDPDAARQADAELFSLPLARYDGEVGA